MYKLFYFSFKIIHIEEKKKTLTLNFLLNLITVMYSCVTTL